MSDQNTIEPLQAIDSFFFKIRIWYANYKRFLLLLIPFFLLALFIIFKFSLYKTKAEGEFVSAKNAYLQWESGKELESSHFETLKGLIRKHPELAAPYESLIIQKVIALGKEKSESSFVESFLKKNSHKPRTHYTHFAKTTLLIEKGEVEKALQEALSLKEEMLSDKIFWESQKTPHFGSILFAFNLLRVAMLSKNLERQEDELVAWRELQQYAKWDEEGEKNLPNLDKKAFDALLQHFTDQNLSIKDYIKHREAKLVAQLSIK